MIRERRRARPNVFIIGAPRSGTTAIATYLLSHPRVFLSKMKEPQYFASDFKNRPVRSLRAYENLFSKAKPHVEKVIIDASTWYLFSKVAVSRILEYEPNARFIVMLRDPAEIVLSLHRYLVMHGKENILNFKEAWDAQSGRASGRKLPLGCGDAKMVQYAEWGKLGTQVARLLSIVDYERVLFLTTDELKYEPRKLWVRLLTFLDLDDDGRHEFPKVNESGSGILPYPLRRIVGISRSIATGVMASLGITWNQWSSYSPHWKKENSDKSSVATSIRNSELGFLKEYYIDEVRMLSDLLSIDFLTLWKY